MFLLYTKFQEVAYSEKYFDYTHKIINLSGPLISTSATISGTNSSPKKIEEIPEEILNKVDFLQRIYV